MAGSNRIVTEVEALYSAGAEDAAENLSTTKGDILVAHGTGAVSRVGVGADTQVLTADSGETTGVKWAAVDAADVVFTPTGTVAATNVQDAIAEVSGDVSTGSTGLADHLSDTAGAHAATAISFSPTGTVAATTVQAAVAEVSGDVEAIKAGTSITGVVPAGALKNLLTALAAEGLIVDDTTAS